MTHDNAQYCLSSRIWLWGEKGLYEGEQVAVCLGEAVVVGRSRVCSFSVVRTAAGKKLGREALEKHASYRQISRKHFRVSLLSPDLVEVEDLSTNGTSVNGYRVARIQLKIAGDDKCIGRIEFGANEAITIQRSPVDRPSSKGKGGNSETGAKSDGGIVSGEVKR